MYIWDSKQVLCCPFTVFFVKRVFIVYFIDANASIKKRHYIHINRLLVKQMMKLEEEISTVNQVLFLFINGGVLSGY